MLEECPDMEELDRCLGLCGVWLVFGDDSHLGPLHWAVWCLMLNLEHLACVPGECVCLWDVWIGSFFVWGFSFLSDFKDEYIDTGCGKCTPSFSNLCQGETWPWTNQSGWFFFQLWFCVIWSVGSTSTCNSILRSRVLHLVLWFILMTFFLGGGGVEHWIFHCQSFWSLVCTLTSFTDGCLLFEQVNFLICLKMDGWCSLWEWLQSRKHFGWR